MSKLEVASLAGLLAAVVWLILRRYNLAPYSDPGLWYACGRDFGETFAASRRAYGFPLVMAIAIRLVGPYAAFLVNVAILPLLVAGIYLLTRRLVAGAGELRVWAPLAAGLAALFYVWANLTMLPYLANPYRDPLSFLLMAAGATALAGYRFTPLSLRRPALAGLALGFALSVRETSVLLLPALLLYAVVVRLRHRHLPFARPFVAFLIAFAAACLPFAVQNYLVTGHALLPAQATKSQTFKGSLIPGVDLDFLTRSLPGCLDLAARHFGPLLLAFAGLAVIVALWRRDLREAVLGFLAPAALTYLVFYGAYIYPVKRYLAVLDVFVVPLAAFGAVVVLDLAARALRVRPVTPRAAGALGVTAALAAAAIAIHAARPDAKRFRLQDMRALVRDLDHALPADACVVGDRPLGEFVRAFGPRPGHVLNFLTRKVSLLDPDTGPALSALRDLHGNAFLLNRSPQLRRVASLEFDLAPVSLFDADRYHLQDLLETDRFALDQLVPWTSRTVTLDLPVPQAGPHVLEIATGRLSKHPRAFARARLDTRLLTERLPDYDSHYRVELPTGLTNATLTLESDQPLPRALQARLVPEQERLSIPLGGNGIPERPRRLSAEFFTRPRSGRDPYITSRGVVRVPTPAPAQDLFLITLHGRFQHWNPYPPFDFVVSTDHGELATVPVRPGYEPDRVHVAMDGLALKSDETEVTLEMRGNRGGAAWSIRQLDVQRARAVHSLHVVLGQTGDTPLLAEGFHRPETHRETDGPRTWRWTAPNAALWLPLHPTGSTVTLRIRWRDAVPPEAEVAPPRFRLSGAPLTEPVALERDASGRTLTSLHHIPAEEWPMPAALLEIEADEWVPADHGRGRDWRRLGIMLLEVEASSS